MLFKVVERNLSFFKSTLESKLKVLENDLTSVNLGQTIPILVMLC